MAWRLAIIWSAPSHYLIQCWNIVNWTVRNKLQWNFHRNSNIFIQENAFENLVRNMAAILSRPRCVKGKGLATQEPEHQLSWYWTRYPWTYFSVTGLNQLSFEPDVTCILTSRAFLWKHLSFDIIGLKYHSMGSYIMAWHRPIKWLIAWLRKTGLNLFLEIVVFI